MCCHPAARNQQRVHATQSLARNVAFIANLMESGVEFVAVDNPTANRLTLHVMAAFAEHER